MSCLLGFMLRSFTAWPAWVDLSTDIVQYGPDIPTEVDLKLLGNLASVQQRRPFVIPWSNGRKPAPYGLCITSPALPVAVNIA